MTPLPTLPGEGPSSRAAPPSGRRPVGRACAATGSARHGAVVLVAALLLIAAVARWWIDRPALDSLRSPTRDADDVQPRDAEEAIPAERTALAIGAPDASDGSPAEVGGDDALAADAPRMRVTYIDPFGVPTIDFQAMLQLPGVEWHAAAGSSLPIPQVDGVLLVLPTHHVAATAAVPAGTSEIVVRGELGVRWQGSLLIDGLPPRDPTWLTLQLSGTGSRRHNLVGALSAYARRHQIQVAVAAGGRFEIVGLAANSRGTLHAPRSCSFVPLRRTVAGEIELDSARSVDASDFTGLDGGVFRVFRLPTLVGTLVNRGPGSIGKVEVTLGFHHRNRPNEAWAIEKSTSEGSDFSIHLSRAGWRSLELSFLARDAESGLPIGSATTTVDGPISGTLDLGPIELTSAQLWKYRLRDAAGQPIAPSTWIEDRRETEDDRWHHLEDADGELGPVAHDLDALVVTAPGFEPHVVALSGRTPGEPLDVVLQPSTQLIVRCERPAGEAQSSLVLELTAEQPPFAEARLQALRSSAFAAEIAAPAAVEPIGWRYTDERSDETTSEWSIDGLLPGTRARVRLLDTIGTVRAEAQIQAQAAGRQLIELAIDRPTRALRVQVVDGAGAPIRGNLVLLASIDAADDEWNEAQVTSDEGWVEFQPIAADEVRLAIREAPSTELQRGRRFEVSRDGEPLRIELTEASASADRWALEVIVREPHDADYCTAVVEQGGVDVDSADASGEHVGEHMLFHYHFDLERAPARVRYEFAGRLFTFDVAPPQSQLRFDLPSTSRVTLHYDLPLAEEQQRGRLLFGVTLQPLDAAGTGMQDGASVSHELSVAATLPEPLVRAGSIAFPFVLPGRYRVLLRWCEDGDSREAHDFSGLESEATATVLEVSEGAALEALLTR